MAGIEIRGLAAFQKELSAVREKLPEREQILTTKKLALQALRGVVIKTPVDTGRARNAWLVSIGQGTETGAAAPARAPENEVAGVEGQIAIRVIAKGARKINGMKAPYKDVFISNNVEYIEFLEGGSSQQSPRGMVAVTLEELRSQFR